MNQSLPACGIFDPKPCRLSPQISISSLRASPVKCLLPIFHLRTKDTVMVHPWRVQLLLNATPIQNGP